MQENIQKKTDADTYSQAEDAALKAAAIYFGDILFPYLGIEEKPLGIASTEMVHLEIKKMYEDFNYQMKGNRWFHFEFESTRITLDDLKRFREYEAVTTFVICTSNVKRPLSHFTEGLNTYRVEIIRLKSQKADLVFQQLSEKDRNSIEKADLVPLLLTSLMGGSMPQKARIHQSFSWLKQTYSTISTMDLQKMQAVLYALAGKVLEKHEMKEIKEELTMTLLGQMLMEDGIEKGIQLTKAAIKLSAQGESPETIAEKLQVSLDKVLNILED